MNPHLQPWAISPDRFPADGFISDRLEYLLGYAVLAPSPHNTQPWMFRINVSDVEMFADRRRVLPVTDPHGRELRLACGAALMNLRVAAGYFGQVYTLELLPDPANAALLARMTLKLPGESSAEDVFLFPAMVERRTNREAFRPDPIPESLLDELAEAANEEQAWLAVVTQDEAKQALVALVAQADRQQWANREFRKELAGWVRTDAERQADGIPTREMGVRDWMAFAGPALVRTFNRGNDQAARDADIAEHSPALVILCTDGDDARSWLEAGQAMERVLLHAQANGLSASFLNQPLEVDELRTQVAGLIGRACFPQVILRLGYGPEVPPTPRRSVHGLLLAQDHTKAPPH